MTPSAATQDAAAGAAAVAFVGFALAVSDFDARGREFVILAALRFAFLVALAAVAAGVPGSLARWGLRVAAVGAVLYAAGALGAVVTDGWWFEPFAEGGPAEPPWYAYIIGAAGALFAVGTTLVGAAAWRSGRSRLGIAVLAGVTYAAALPLGGPGHVVWALAWLAVGALLLTEADPAT